MSLQFDFIAQAWAEPCPATVDFDEDLPESFFDEDCYPEPEPRPYTDADYAADVCMPPRGVPL